MFGGNPIRKQDLSSPDKLWVQSVFSTIQGEGPMAGLPAIFVRLGGCNLRCWWCDTDFESSTWHPTRAELAEAVMDVERALGRPKHGDTYEPKYTGQLVVITGGEPFRQDITGFCRDLLTAGYNVQIETNGTLWIDAFEEIMEWGPERVTLVCSPKTGLIHKGIRLWCNHWKYISAGNDACDGDGLPVYSTQIRNRPMRLYRPWEDEEWEELRGGVAYTVWIQPLDTSGLPPGRGIYDTDVSARHAATLAMKHGYRLCLQQHKIVGLE